MIKQIVKQLWNERRSNTWLWAELLLVSVALWVIVDWGYVMLRTYTAPRGFNIENTYLLRVSVLTPQSGLYVPAENKTTADGEDFMMLLDKIRYRPDVEFVSVSTYSYPYNGSNSWDSMTSDTISVATLRRRVTRDFFNVFQYENADGSGSQSVADALAENTMIVTSNYLINSNGEGRNPLGMEFHPSYDSTQVSRVAAVTNPVRYDDFDPVWHATYFALGLFEKQIAAATRQDIESYEVCVRVKPGTSPDFAQELLKESMRNYITGNCYIKTVTPFSSIRREFHRDDVKQMKNRGYITFFLLVNIFLGIIGTFWFRTQQRRSEIGLRIALGSPKKSLRLLLLTENLCLLIFAFIPAMIICYNIGQLDLAKIWQMEWGMARFLPGICIAFVLMVLMIIAGIWYPVRQAMKIEPAEALHNE